MPALNAAAVDHPLTLEEAGRRTIIQNPQLDVFQWRTAELAGQRQTASLPPQIALSLEAENVLGNGDFSGVDAAELTLALSSIIELGDKAAGRLAVIDAKTGLMETNRQSAALDLLSEVTRRFLAAQALQARLEVATEARALTSSALQQVRSQVERGAAPKVEQLRAEASQAQAELEYNAVTASLQSSKLDIATLWGGERVDFGHLQGDLFQFPPVAPFEQLYRRVVESPTIRIFGAERRVREAELSLARARSRSDIGWSVGVRRFQDSDDYAMTFGLDIPLSAADRNTGNVQSAVAARNAVDYRQQAGMRALRAQLYRAWHSYQQSSAAALKLRDHVLPILKAALVETGEGYSIGRYRYLDWMDARHALLDTRLAMIDAAKNALLNLALIEQLTGTPAVSSAAEVRH